MKRGPDLIAIGSDVGDRLLGDRILIHFKKCELKYVTKGSKRHNAMITSFKGDKEFPVSCRIEKTYHGK